jgi:hypothetical protein
MFTILLINILIGEVVRIGCIEGGHWRWRRGLGGGGRGGGGSGRGSFLCCCFWWHIFFVFLVTFLFSFVGWTVVVFLVEPPPRKSGRQYI